MTEIKCIEQSEKLLKGQLNNEEFLILVKDFMRYPKHFMLYQTMRDLYLYFKIHQQDSTRLAI